MDVTVYPPPPQPLAASEHPRLGQLSYPDPAFGTSKLDGDSMFLNLPETDFSSNQFRVPQPPHPHQPLPLSKVTPNQQPWRRDTHLPWSYQVGGLSDEDFNIPPITPPTLPDHMLPPHLPHDSRPGPYHPLEPPPSSYQLQGLDLDRGALMNQDRGALMNQDRGALVNQDRGALMNQDRGALMNQDRGALVNQDGGTFSPDGGPMTSTLSVMQQMVNSDSRFTSSQQPIEAALGPRSQSGVSQQSQLSTINQSQLGLSGNAVHHSPSPPGSKSATPSPSSSAHEDDNDDTLRLGGVAEKRPASVDISKKPKTPKKKKRKDPNEPVKPVSAYALFFRDTQANIKAQNPNATFGEVSKIVASMWDGLGDEQKQEYKKRTETAKKEYLKQLAAYRASLVSQSYNDPSEMKPPHPSSTPSSSSTSMFTPKPSVYPGGHPGGQHHSSSGSLHPLQPHPHPSMYLPYPHPSHPSHPSHASSPGLSPHLPPQIHPQLQALSSRGTAPRPSVPHHQGGLSLGSMVAASTPPLQVSPPLHSQAHLGGLHSPHHQNHQNNHQNHHQNHQNHQNHHQNHQNQQQLSGLSMGMTHSQGYQPSLQSDYQQLGGNMLNAGGVMSSSVDYHQLGRHMPNHHLNHHHPNHHQHHQHHPNHHPSLDWTADYHGNGALQRDKPLYLS
ncbi:thymocyte selection-associated high mobility group box protein TOX [Centropristis striata]|uniref:thymocyte selection-associated high mobility group box protein TOX n=1 Tax=Centropristis striata TaxID=184440 RepID=UPI0027E1D199|nr:thymocyte selection-associated high mobility group box protein TOX [Centropristis striata]